MFSSHVKLYTAHVTIERGLAGLRPGMSAEVEILVTELPDVLSVPVQAILPFKGKDHVAVKTEHGYDWRDVALGLSNDKLVEIKQGLKNGEVVALNPMALLSEDKKQELFGAGKTASVRKAWGAAPAGARRGPGQRRRGRRGGGQRRGRPRRQAQGQRQGPWRVRQP